MLSFLLVFVGPVLMVLPLLASVYYSRKKNKFSPFTEKLLRSPGYTLGKKRDDKVAEASGYLFFTGLLPIYFFGIYKHLSPLGLWVSGVLVGGIVLWGCRKIMQLYDEIQPLSLGLDGEVYTGQELNFLMRLGAWVFHDIPYKYGNIDHIVISTGGIYVVETKAYRKPAGEDGNRQSRVKVIDGKLCFPHATTDNPIRQAKVHAQHIKEFLHKKTGNNYPVIPVVALPGWFVETDKNTDFLVINPKRGGGLRSFVDKPIISLKETEIIAKLVEEYARSVPSRADKNDPDASNKYDFWLNRKHEEDSI